MAKPTGNNRYVTVDDVRAYLGDKYPEDNLLLGANEFRNEEITAAMDIVVDYWNSIPPHIGKFTIYDFPYRDQLISATAGKLLEMASYRFQRNALPIQGGGVSVDDQNKAQQYAAAGAALWNAYREFVHHEKLARQTEFGWGWA